MAFICFATCGIDSPVGPVQPPWRSVGQLPLIQQSMAQNQWQCCVSQWGSVPSFYQLLSFKNGILLLSNEADLSYPVINSHDFLCSQGWAWKSLIQPLFFLYIVLFWLIWNSVTLSAFCCLFFFSSLICKFVIFLYASCSFFWHQWLLVILCQNSLRFTSHAAIIFIPGGGIC